ncbi:VWA domain-containing protein [Roseovarius aestuariivivens]|uniref:VWA domain-containing protein n=1 Tax=Roseovarius aestuariivivens TaxID=1888910 RepID=UPI001080C542|nr:VWA domain-containing protein [Roseovarius aestuariivivens]
MTDLDVTLLRPMWLLVVPLLLGAAWWLLGRRGGIGDWDRVIDPELLAAMAALGRIDRTPSRRPILAALAIALLCVLALSGPAVEKRDTVSYRNLDGVLFVVDTSPSVTDHKRWPQMLTMGRFGFAGLGTRPGGLIVFSGDAYVATDMTADHAQLGQTFSLIDVGTVPDPGSRPERALDLAAQLLEDAKVIAGDVVLFSDGAGLGATSLKAAERIAAQEARLSVVALDTATPEMAVHAALADGRVFTLEDTDAFAAYLGEDARTRLERQEFPLLFWRDMGRYALLLTLVPLAFLFRRHPA